MHDNQAKLITEAKQLCDSIITTDTMWKGIDPEYAELVKEPLERRLQSVVTELHESFHLDTA